MEESENQLVDNLEDSEESGDNMIIVSSSEDNKQQQDQEEEEEDEELVLDDEDATLGESLGDEVNDAKENDDNIAAGSSVVETVEKNTPKPVTKKTKKKDKGK